jgi:hypothetical protein
MSCASAGRQGPPRRRDARRRYILDPDSLPKAVEGVSAIVHLAAAFRTPDTNLIWNVLPARATSLTQPRPAPLMRVLS